MCTLYLCDRIMSKFYGWLKCPTNWQSSSSSVCNMYAYIRVFNYYDSKTSKSKRRSEVKIFSLVIINIMVIMYIILCSALICLGIKYSCFEWWCFFQLDPPPEFLAQRQELWDKLKKEHDDWLAAQVPQPIKITLPDGKVLDGESWRTTPYQIASGIRFVLLF